MFGFLPYLQVAEGRERVSGPGRRRRGSGKVEAGKWGHRRVSGFQSRVAASALGEGRETGRVRDSGSAAAAEGAASGEEEKRRGGCGAARGCSL
ncbi:unnamed protein product [Linum trigynum]|uniref:Uncharacterized protein n=1 Tax=Linum trigynum TaxID=586398 RepID=A0AAV2E6A9_9ROSI